VGLAQQVDLDRRQLDRLAQEIGQALAAARRAGGAPGSRPGCRAAGRWSAPPAPRPRSRRAGAPPGRRPPRPPGRSPRPGRRRARPERRGAGRRSSAARRRSARGTRRSRRRRNRNWRRGTARPRPWRLPAAEPRRRPSPAWPSWPRPEPGSWTRARTTSPLISSPPSGAPAGPFVRVFSCHAQPLQPRQPGPQQRRGLHRLGKHPAAGAHERRLPQPLGPGHQVLRREGLQHRPQGLRPPAIALDEPLEVLGMGEVQPAAPGHQELAPEGRHLLEHRHRPLSGLRRHQPGRPAADHGDVGDLAGTVGQGPPATPAGQAPPSFTATSTGMGRGSSPRRTGLSGCEQASLASIPTRSPRSRFAKASLERPLASQDGFQADASTNISRRDSSKTPCPRPFGQRMLHQRRILRDWRCRRQRHDAERSPAGLRDCNLPLRT
jgi:hypothetical protein